MSVCIENRLILMPVISFFFLDEVASTNRDMKIVLERDILKMPEGYVTLRMTILFQKDKIDRPPGLVCDHRIAWLEKRFCQK